MKFLMILRHSERIDEMNPSKCEDLHDPELTERGRTMAQQTGKWIAQFIKEKFGSHFPDIYFQSSPYYRCIQTAQLLHNGLLEELMQH